MNSPLESTVPTILVADDQPSVSNVIARVLRMAGYNVVAANGSIEALRLAFCTPKIDLLVTDMEMPQMRGDELAAEVLRIHPNAALLIVSSSTEFDAPKPFEFLPKPFTLSGLNTAVNRCLQVEQTPVEI